MCEAFPVTTERSLFLLHQHPLLESSPKICAVIRVGRVLHDMKSDWKALVVLMVSGGGDEVTLGWCRIRIPTVTTDEGLAN